MLDSEVIYVTESEANKRLDDDLISGKDWKRRKDQLITNTGLDRLSSPITQTLAELEERFNRNGGKGFMSNKKAKNWENYQAWFNELGKDPEQSYNRLFGEIFAEAYEKKIAELNSVRNIQ